MDAEREREQQIRASADRSAPFAAEDMRFVVGLLDAAYRKELE